MVNPTPVSSPSSSGSLASFDILILNAARTDDAVLLRLQPTPPSRVAAPPKVISRTVDFAVESRMETAPLLHAVGRGGSTNRKTLVGTKPPESGDKSNLGKRPFNGTVFHDSPRKKAARAYAEYVHPVLDSRELGKPTTEFLSFHDEMNESNFAAGEIPGSYTRAMLFEGDEETRARCRAAAGYVHPKDKEATVRKVADVESA